MQWIDGHAVYSATDLVGFLACEHLANLERASIAGLVQRPMRADPQLDRIAMRGEQHEARFLAELAREGVAGEGCWSGQEEAEGENEKKEENEEERGESETPVLTAAAAKNSKGRRGRRGSSARKRGAVAAGRR